MEAEVFLQGNWKNIEEMEENLSLEELEALLKAGREKEHRLMKFYALFKGVDLDEDNSREDAFEAVQKRAEARLSGKSKEEVDSDEFAEFGIKVIT